MVASLVPVRPRAYAHNLVWDINLLSWVAMQQPILNAGTVTVTGVATETTLLSVKTNTDHLLMFVASGSVSSSGNNLCITPTAGKKIRLHYISYNNAAAVEAAFRFGAAGTLFLRNSLTVAGCVIAKDFGDFRYIEGAINEVLNINLGTAVTVIWDAFYTEI